MIEIPDSSLTDFTGFTVYDSETGDPVEAADVVMTKVKYARFDLTEEGKLAVVFIDLWDDFESVILQHVGKYLVQFGNGNYMRW